MQTVATDRPDMCVLRSAVQRVKDLPSPATRRALRVDAGVTQAMLADVVGCSRPAISAYEKGSRTPRGRHLERYVEALRVLREEGK